MTLKKKEYFVVKISLTIGYYFFQSLLIFHGIAISTYKASNWDIIPINNCNYRTRTKYDFFVCMGPMLFIKFLLFYTDFHSIVLGIFL